MNALQLPAELWMQIAMNDPKTYNALARVNKAIAACLDAKAAQKLFTSKIKVTYKGEWDYYDVVYPTLGGMIHAPCYSVKRVKRYGSYRITCYYSGTFSYGKLTKSSEHRPSFRFSGSDINITIYADKGVVTRDNGPAIILKYTSEWNMSIAELHVSNGDIGELRCVWWPDDNVPEIIEVNFVENTDMSRVLTSLLTRNRPEKVPQSVDVIIKKYGRDSDVISRGRVGTLAEYAARLDTRIAMLGANIPSILKNIFKISDIMYDVIMGRK